VAAAEWPIRSLAKEARSERGERERRERERERERKAFGENEKMNAGGSADTDSISGAAFTTLYFLRNSRMGLVSWSVCPRLAFPA
jgi:hypothetical protein